MSHDDPREQPVAVPRSGTLAKVLVLLLLAGIGGLHFAAALRAPLLFLPDSMDYAVQGVRWLESGTFDRLGTWRVPGYPVVYAFFHATMRAPAAGLALLNAACVIGVLAVVGGILARRVGCVAAGVAVALIGLDPVVLLYQQAAMPEMIGTLFVTLLGAGLIGLDSKCVWRAGLGGRVFGGVLIGGLLAAGVFLRANFQVLVPLVGVGIVLAGRRHAGRALGMGVMAGVTAAVLVLPWVVRTHAMSGRWSLVVGTGITRAISAVEVGALDLEQPERLEPAVLDAIRVRAAAGRLGPYDLLDGLSVQIRETEPDAKRVALDALCAELAGESARRHPARHRAMQARAFVNVAGLWPLNDTGYRENQWWAKGWVEPVTQHANHFVGAAGYRELPESEVQPIVSRTLHERPRVGEWVSGALRAWWVVWEWLRVGLAWGTIVGIAMATYRGRFGLAVALAIPFVHAGVLAWVTWSGIDRYGVPFVPMTMLGGVYGVWALVGVRRGSSRRN